MLHLREAMIKTRTGTITPASIQCLIALDENGILTKIVCSLRSSSFRIVNKSTASGKSAPME